MSRRGSHRRLLIVIGFAWVRTVLAGAVGPGLPACHLGGCGADTEGGGGGALSLLQADGAKAAAAVRRRSPHQRSASDAQDAQAEAEPFASLLEVHQQTLATVSRLASNSKVRGAFSCLVILPVLGFAATMLAIAATVMVEQRVASRPAQSSDALPGRPAFSPHGDVLLGAGNIYKSMRSMLYGEQPPPMAPRSRPPSSHLRPPGAEALLQQPQQPQPGAVGRGIASSYSPSFAEHHGAFAPEQGAYSTMPSLGAAMGDTIIVTQPLDGGRLGLKLTDDTLQITGFSDERAHGFGFQIGDRIVKVNGVDVSEEGDFMQAVRRALELNQMQGQPMAFTVVRSGKSPEGMGRQVSGVDRAAGGAPVTPGHPAHAGGASADVSRSPAPSKSPGMIGSWAYSDDSGQYGYQISREASAGLLLHFSQRTPDAGLVVGTLSPMEGGWYEGTLSLESGMRHGILRLRHDRNADEMVSLLKMQGSSDFGEEVRSRRLSAPSTSPAATARADAPLALPFASVPTSPASLQAYDHGSPPSQPTLTLPETR